jgi:hypothetical protein
VARAILFSSPWDFVVTGGNVEILAPRLATPAETPPERWFGGYHGRENMAALLAKSFLALRIPPQNMRVFKGDLLAQQKDQRDENPYHGLGPFGAGLPRRQGVLLGRSP